MRQAAKYRPLTDEQVESLAAEVDEELRLCGVTEVTTQDIGVAVLDRLRSLDPVVYLRFASVYKGFEDPADFEREATALIGLGGLTKVSRAEVPERRGDARSESRRRRAGLSPSASRTRSRDQSNPAPAQNRRSGPAPPLAASRLERWRARRPRSPRSTRPASAAAISRSARSSAASTIGCLRGGVLAHVVEDRALGAGGDDRLGHALDPDAGAATAASFVAE